MLVAIIFVLRRHNFSVAGPAQSPLRFIAASDSQFKKPSSGKQRGSAILGPEREQGVS